MKYAADPYYEDAYFENEVHDFAKNYPTYWRTPAKYRELVYEAEWNRYGKLLAFLKGR